MMLKWRKGKMKCILWWVVVICMQMSVVVHGAMDDMRITTFQLFDDLAMVEEKNTSSALMYSEMPRVCRISNHHADQLIRQYIKETQRGISREHVARGISIITATVPLYADRIGNDDGIISKDELIAFEQLAVNSDALVYLFCMISVYMQ